MTLLYDSAFVFPMEKCSLYNQRVSCLHFEKWDPKCGITEISVVITVAQKAQYD